MDVPPLSFVSHNEWRKLTHNPVGILVLKAVLGKRFSVEEGVKHVLVDEALPYKQREIIAKLLGE